MLTSKRKHSDFVNSDVYKRQVFTGEQSFTDRQYGPVEVRIREGRYNAAGTVAVWLEIVWNENVYELDFQKGVRQWDFQSLKVKSSEKTIILKK